MAQFETFQHLPRGTEENHKKPQDGLCSGQDLNEELPNMKEECSTLEHNFCYMTKYWATYIFHAVISYSISISLFCSKNPYLVHNLQI
jgi:hypothetical protein